MLSVCARRWPDGGRWVLQPKWDGFRLLLHVGADGEGVRGLAAARISPPGSDRCSHPSRT